MDRGAVPVVEALMAAPAVVALVMVLLTAALTVALDMPLVTASRLEAGLEEVALMPPIEVARPISGLAVGLMLPLTIAQPAESNLPGFGSLQ